MQTEARRKSTLKRGIRYECPGEIERWDEELKEERRVKEGREKGDLFNFELMECVPTHQLSSARLWGSREGIRGDD